MVKVLSLAVVAALVVCTGCTPVGHINNPNYPHPIYDASPSAKYGRK